MYYIYDTRFQPFNNENLAELNWVLNKINRGDQIIIGIINPVPLNPDPNDFPGSWTRFRKEYNPLSYWERYQTIKLIIKSIGCEDMVAGIVPLPRPSVNMSSANNFLPPKSERKICVPLVLDDALENTKIEGLNNQGESSFKIPAYTFSVEDRIVSPELITCLIALGYSRWDKFVPETIRSYLDSIHMQSTVVKNFNYYDAKEALNRVYVQMKEEALKNEMRKHFSQYLNDDILSQPSFPDPK